VAAPSSQWIARSAARNGRRAKPLNLIVRTHLEPCAMSIRRTSAHWMSPLIGLLCSIAAPVAIAEDLDIRASRSGYNLLWPTNRCCAFDLHISGDGVATVVVKRSEGKEPTSESQTLTLSPETMAKLRKLIDDNEFFSLPQDLGPWPIDGDEQRIVIRIGDRAHHVSFAQPSSNPTPDLRRVLNVWRGLKAIFQISGENVERANAF
jgi:hypothetical protein